MTFVSVIKNNGINNFKNKISHVLNLEYKEKILNHKV